MDMEYVIQQNKELKRTADDIQELKQQVNLYKDSVREAWRSNDSMALRDASDRLSHMLGQISAELYEIAHDILVCAQELEEEHKAEADLRE